MAIRNIRIPIAYRGFLMPALTAVLWIAPCEAATTIEFAVTDSGSDASRTQIAYVKDGRIYVRSAGGDANIDLLFTSNNSSIALINHGDRSYTHVDENKVSELADAMSLVQKQLAENLALLPPEQAARMKEMMGSFGLPTENPRPEPPKKLVRRGIRSVNNIQCRQIDVVSDRGKLGQLCVATAAAMSIPDADYQTIEALKAFAERLARSASKIRNQLGDSVPNIFGLEVEGVPVEMRDVSGRAPSSMMVTRVASGVGDTALAIPSGYQPRPLPSLTKLRR